MRPGLLIAATATLLAVSPSAASALTAQATGVTATEGNSFSGPVATVSDLPIPGCPAPGYSVSVHWADGSAPPATIGPGTLSVDMLSCTYPVNAAHTFIEEGTETFQVTVSGTPDTTGTATVADAPVTAVAPAITATAGAPLQGAVATFTDGDPGAAASDFTATINWGDGTPATPGATTAGPAGGFSVSPEAAHPHTYAAPGSFTTVITVRDQGGSAGSATGAVTVTASPPPTNATPPAAPQTAASSTGPAVVGVSAPSVAGPRSFFLRLTCPAPGPYCRGVARVITLPTQAAKSPLPGDTVLGSALFVLVPGQARTVSIGVPPRLRRILHHAHSARVAGVVIAFGLRGHSMARTSPTAEITTAGLR